MAALGGFGLGSKVFAAPCSSCCAAVVLGTLLLPAREIGTVAVTVGSKSQLRGSGQQRGMRETISTQAQ